MGYKFYYYGTEFAKIKNKIFKLNSPKKPNHELSWEGKPLVRSFRDSRGNFWKPWSILTRVSWKRRMVNKRKMKIFKPSFARKFTACALLIGVALVSFSPYGHCDSSAITVTATVMPKTPQIDYKKLWNNIDRKIQGYKKNVRKTQGKFIRVTVCLDWPDGGQGISVEKIGTKWMLLIRRIQFEIYKYF